VRRSIETRPNIREGCSWAKLSTEIQEIISGTDVSIVTPVDRSPKRLWAQS
jgi:hypothetical protein